MPKPAPLRDEIFDYVMAFQGCRLSALIRAMREQHGFCRTGVHKALKSLKATGAVHVAGPNLKRQILYADVRHAQPRPVRQAAQPHE